MIGPALVAGLLAASAQAAGQTPCRFDEAERALASSKFREAAAGFRKCQDAGRRERNASTLARALIGESNALRSLGGLQESRALAQLGLEVARSAADPELLAMAHEAMGDASYALRLYEPALQSFRAALPLWRRAGNTMAEVTDLKNIGIAHLSLRQIDQALLYLEEASRKDPEAGQGALAVSILGNLGTAYLRVGAHRSALERFEEALRVAERLNSPVEIHDVLTRLGWLHLSLGFPDAALHDFRRGLTFDSAAPHGHRVWLREGLAEALETTGNLEDARKAYEDLLALYRRANDATGVTYSLNGLATQESRLDPRAARLLFQEALETSRGAEGRFAWDAWRGLARLDRSAGDLDRAVAEYDEAFRAFLAFRQALAEPRARALVSSPDLASELLEALAERGGADDARRAFEVFEQSHGRVLLETLRARRKGEVEKEPDASLLGLQARAADLRRRLVAPETPGAEEHQLLDELLRVEATIDERLFSDRGRQSEPPVDVATVEQIQTLLGPHRALLAYAFGPNRLLGIVLTHRTLSIRLLDPPAEDLSRRISVYLDLVGESPSEGWKAVSRELYGTLVGPFAEDLSGAIDTLVIIPDGPLAFLPFDTLLGPTTGGERHLLERYRIFSVPSATVLQELTRPPSGTGSAGTLVVAGPDTVSAAATGLSPLAKQARRIYAEQGLGLKPLAHVLSEARQVLDIAGPPAQLLSGASATEEAFRAMPLARYQVFHFATHGLLSERAPERSALVLIPGPSGEQDGYLQAREIAQLHLGAELVVLSACRSSRGRLVAGEGAEGLARAFLQAGARSVVASLWDVEDAPTEALMSSFYRHLAAGEAKADALRAAKLERIGQKLSSARHWAAFVLFGDGLGTVKLRGPVRPARGPDARPRTFVLVALGAAALAAGFLILRHRA